MSKYDVPTSTEAWAALRAVLEQMNEQANSPEVKLTDLAKLYESLCKHMLAMAKDCGLPSIRFEAAARALDLGTKKSELLRFLGDQS